MYVGWEVWREGGVEEGGVEGGREEGREGEGREGGREGGGGREIAKLHWPNDFGLPTMGQ